MNWAERAGWYKGFEILAKAATTGTRFDAYDYNEIAPSAHATTLDGIKEQIDEIVAEKIKRQKERHGE